MASDAFAHVIGHERACTVLRRALASNRLPHAILVVGPAGVGRRTLAKALIANFLAAPLPSSIFHLPTSTFDFHPDFIRLIRETDTKTGKEKSLIGVEQVREVREQLSRSAFSGRKALLIEEADKLGVSAQTLLKTLEEPPGDCLIVLRAPTIDTVPATIVSRCQVIRLHTVARAEIAQALVNKGLDAMEAQKLARLALGSPGHALRLLRDGAFRAEADIGLASFISCFGGSLPEGLRAAAALLPKEEANKSMMLARVLAAWEQTARDVLLHQCSLSTLATRDDAALLALVPQLPTARLQRVMHAIRQTERDAASHVNPLLALEHIILM